MARKKKAVSAEQEEKRMGTIAPNHFGNGANTLEPRVAAPARVPVDRTAGTNTGSAANLFEQRVTAGN